MQNTYTENRKKSGVIGKTSDSDDKLFLRQAGHDRTLLETTLLIISDCILGIKVHDLGSSLVSLLLLFLFAVAVPQYKSNPILFV